MKRIATVLILIGTLAVASTAFAQAQRWEYAVLLRSQFGYSFAAPGVDLVGSLDEYQSLYSKLVEIYGAFGGPLAGDHFKHIGALNILGNAGWELVAVAVGPYGLEYYLKRPLRG